MVGVGNLDRGDDGAGVVAARRVQNTRAKEVGDCTDLLDIWDGEGHVIVVDAMRSGSPPGTVMRFDVNADELPSRMFPSTHAFGLAETVELARALGRLPRSLMIYGIEVGQLDPGSTLSPEVDQAVQLVAAEIDAELV